ncbi:unnamed protein product, partial [Allacma fusca]
QRLRRPPFKPNPASSVLNSKSSFGPSKNEAQKEIIYMNQPTGIRKMSYKAANVNQGNFNLRKKQPAPSIV